MRSSNPVFSRRREFATFGQPGQFQQGQNAQYSQQGYGQPQPHVQPGYPQPGQQEPGAFGLDYGRPQQTRDAMTLDDVVMRTGMLFAVLLAVAAVTWGAVSFGLIPLTAAMPLWLLAIVVTLGLGIWINMSRTVRPGLILTYAAIEGFFVGLVSAIFESFMDGIVFQAVLATLCVFGVMLAAYRFRIIRATNKLYRFLAIAVPAYMVFVIINLGLVLFTDVNLRMGPLGLAISLFAVGLASLCLILDFDQVERGIANRLPREHAWMAAFGLMVTLVWLYIEMLRLIMILRSFAE